MPPLTVPPNGYYVLETPIDIQQSGFHLLGTGADIASATTIAPTSQVHRVTGTTAIATITVPTLASGVIVDGAQLVLIPTGAFTTTTAGNVAIASTAVVGKALIMTYLAATSKWYPSY